MLHISFPLKHNQMLQAKCTAPAAAAAPPPPPAAPELLLLPGSVSKI